MPLSKTQRLERDEPVPSVQLLSVYTVIGGAEDCTELFVTRAIKYSGLSIGAGRSGMSPALTCDRGGQLLSDYLNNFE
jgi:hypothetical protein